MGTQPPLPKRDRAPIFGACLLWSNGWIDQYATWYGGKPRPGDVVLDGVAAPLPKRGTTAPPPLFGPCLLWPNGWMDEDATWYGSSWPWPRPYCVRRGPSSSPHERGTAASPSFRPMFIVATVAHLGYHWALVSFWLCNVWAAWLAVG